MKFFLFAANRHQHCLYGMNMRDHDSLKMTRGRAQTQSENFSYIQIEKKKRKENLLFEKQECSRSS